MHAQYNISSLDSSIPFGSALDKVYVTEPVPESEGCFNLDHFSTLKICLNEKSVVHFQNGYFSLQIFGTILTNGINRAFSNSLDYLPTSRVASKPEEMKDPDHIKYEKAANCISSARVQSQPLVLPPSFAKQTSPVQFDHYFTAFVEICELSLNGFYESVPVQTDSYFSPNDPGCFLLRQGVQRRLALTIQHGNYAKEIKDIPSQSGLRINSVSSIEISNIRKVENVRIILFLYNYCLE